ncbi:SRPBCC family protein [Aurantibacillus circumpalustris]|uniref:SRPBCC family protein n=1 Tax=Aurantibacillus circumpalustris TaxID=3036359 RepID=UPI00295C2532|nr:SRPBCC domain-containing protein [Aurantibacillus circumpalustris]
MTQTQPYSIERVYNASVSKVWKAITDKNEMKHWYFDLKEFRAEIGFEFQFTGTGSKGENYLHLCKVVDVIPQKKLSYTWCYDGLPGESLVSFELFKEGEKTRVKLTHKGIESFASNNQDFAKESFMAGWTEIIGKNLKNFVEK